jgi:hypothetical protein
MTDSHTKCLGIGVPAVVFGVSSRSSGSKAVATHALGHRRAVGPIAALLAGDSRRIVDLTPAAVTKDEMRTAFAVDAESHESASIRRCWSTWNTLCAFLYTSDAT